MSIADEFPLIEENDEILGQSQQSDTHLISGDKLSRKGYFRIFWAQLRDFGLAEPVMRIGTHVLVIILGLIVVWGMRKFYINSNSTGNIDLPQRAAFAAPEVTKDNVISQPLSTPEEPAKKPILPPFLFPKLNSLSGIPRRVLLHTTIPNRPRVEVSTYIVQPGDTIFGIAEKFGLKPETIFWGNRELLGDNPHKLRADQELNILPVDGTYHKWSEGESFQRVVEFYGVETSAVVEYPGNPFDPYTFDIENPNIEPSTNLIIPGGRRQLIDWGPPRIPRDNPAVARTYGPGHCGTLADGAIGTGLFIWPTSEKHLSGYDFSPAANHSGIDIAGDTGNPIYAVDAGVVVYAGWSNYGYGNLIVLDHGNGWQSLYAHLNGYNVGCGQSVFQGTVIGALGNTGNSSGSHLHFELMYGTAKVNPWNYLTP